MCKVKTGKNVRTDRDLQNLVTSVILRQRRSFDRNEIVSQTKSKLRDSEMQLDNQELEKMISRTLGVLECNGVVGKKDGIYIKKEMIFV